MTEPLTPEEQLEWRARVEHLITDRILMATDTEKRRQDIRFAPLTLLATGIGAGAALMAAATAFAAALLKWLQS
jgi:hypothetical protein